jgi:outer membrane PBP1 activator LpoA protein
MQRVLPTLSIWFLTLFALYACASNVPHTPVDEKPATVSKEIGKPSPPAAMPEKSSATPVVGLTPVPPVTAVETPAAVMPSEVRPAPPAPPVLPTEKPFPHIALLLPLQSPVFGSSADAVQQGFMAAIDPKRLLLPVRVYSNFDENSGVVSVYRHAIANGARAVVGPLTRSGVSALAAEQDIPVPTLALNIVEGQPAKQLYFFGMAVEAEARQAALMARKHGLHQAIIITTRSQLSQRLQAAFEEEWIGPANGTTQGIDRGILREIEFNDDPSVFADIADITDTTVFLAADAEKARLIRPYLPNKLPIYATSQIFVGNDNTLTNYDLNGIRFVDMPWLLQPDHPAVMIYPRASPPLSTDRERLYALGIDSFRLIQLLLTGKVASSLPLDGVSGQIQLSGHTFQRTPIPAVFVQGRAQLPDSPTAPAPQIFPEGTINTP